jgi:hypothetical protein
MCREGRADCPCNERQSTSSHGSAQQAFCLSPLSKNFPKSSQVFASITPNLIPEIDADYE